MTLLSKRARASEKGGGTARQGVLSHPGVWWHCSPRVLSHPRSVVALLSKGALASEECGVTALQGCSHIRGVW